MWAITLSFHRATYVFLIQNKSYRQSPEKNMFKIFCQNNKFFYLQSISSFPTSVCPETFHSFYYCKAI